MVMDIKIDDKQLKTLAATLADTPKNIPKETSKAINNTAKGHITDIAKQFRKVININVKGSKEALEQNIKSRPNKLSANVRVKPTVRPPLKRFKARQSKAGVTYQIEKGGVKGMIPGAFGPKIDKLNKHVFLRKNPYVRGAGPQVNKAIKIAGHGPNMLAVYKKKKMKQWSMKEVNLRLNKEIEKRVKFILYKQNKEAAKP